MSLSTRQRLVLGIVCAIPVAMVVVLALQPKRELAATGGDCRSNVFCESGECLHRAKKNAYGQDEAQWDAPGGVCTAPCDDDRGCPSTMRCGPVVERALLPGAGGGDGAPRCIPRAWLE